MFKSIKDTLDKGVAAVSVKSESIVESSRVRTAIATAQKTMDQELSALGVKCYNSWLSGGTDQEELEALSGLLSENQGHPDRADRPQGSPGADQGGRKSDSGQSEKSRAVRRYDFLR